VKTSVIIVTSNFARFIGESIRSVLSQEKPPSEILVVDDGSTDETVDILRDLAAHEQCIKVVFQENQGHLAALNAGVSAASGDVLFFLDGDDTYERGHVGNCLEVFRDHPHVDLVATAYRVFGKFEDVVRRHAASGILGSSAVAAMAAHYWAVGPTSCLALRRPLADRIFPYPEQWLSHRVQAGEAGIVLGASMLGAREYFLAEPTMNYRSHESNFDLARRKPAEASYRVTRLCCEVIEKFRLQAGLPVDFERHVLAEFQTWSRPGKSEWRCYSRIIRRGDAPFLKKCDLLFRAWKHYMQSR
jgi:glycosyltransferase involved in cell wall biosynthesis